MARARVCDRCNKVMLGNDKYYGLSVCKYGINNCSKERRLDLEYELCNECINDFEDFIKNNEKE